MASITKDIMGIIQCKRCKGDQYFHLCVRERHFIANTNTKEEDCVKIIMCENCGIKDFNFHICKESIHDLYGKEFIKKK